MAKENVEETITIDGVEYPLKDMSDQAKAQIANIQFVDQQLQQLNNEWAVSDTARLGYSHALQKELEELKSKN